LDGGSKQNWAERFRSRTYPLVYVFIPLITALHVYRSYERHDGQVLAWIGIGTAFLLIAIWFGKKLD
ncbi:MAG: hypothetical protein ACXVZV_15830, partial [Terriglobales bacterium]